MSVSVGLGNRAKSVMYWVSAEICRLYPGSVWPLFMASSFMRMKVASGSVLDMELRSPICSRRLSYSPSLSRCLSSSFIFFSCSRRTFFCSLSVGSGSDDNASFSSPISEGNASGVNSTTSVSAALSCTITSSICFSRTRIFSCSFARFFSTVLRHTNVYLLAFDSIFVPSIYSTSSVMKPRSASRSTTCVKMC